MSSLKNLRTPTITEFEVIKESAIPDIKPAFIKFLITGIGGVLFFMFGALIAKYPIKTIIFLITIVIGATGIIFIRFLIKRGNIIKAINSNNVNVVTATCIDKHRYRHNTKNRTHYYTDYKFLTEYGESVKYTNPWIQNNIEINTQCLIVIVGNKYTCILNKYS